MSDTDDLRAASRALKDAISGLSRALGQGLADVGADVGREIATELNDAAAELSRELAGASGAARARRAARTTKAEQTRADLLGAARSVFAEHGYEAASVADLAKAAGYTKGALYAHFSSKEELFVTLVREANDASESGLEDPTLPLGEPGPGEHGLADVMLSLEAYLYALRHPEARPAFVPMAEKSLRNLAGRVRYLRAGTVGEPTRDDLDTAMALAACWTVGGIMEQLLPPAWDVAGALDRIGERLAGDAPA
ncbi:TetR/AcrR family transcriptional regulator [Xylanimonas protaetiae]|uniref:TetR/AcrR family transcriptional regulator n=1 Tax=Xylanimonas protaetiae TaxID=2509457 RepID=A0A4P6F694_9MICO|nr:TetR/AcrR family transcriptional regulator [Xylanimonas protaetiae]QAY71154.1 TetR/AcrR family transcriptional regulator [Xylanimonas protaetiae]